MKNPTSELTPEEERAELVRIYEETEDEGRVIPPGGCCIACLGCGCLFWFVITIILVVRAVGHFIINHTV